MSARQNFGFETTLSGRGHLKLVKRLKADGWRVELFYLALPSVEVARLRVAERVSHGGHDVPAPDIERRYFRSLDNLFDEYASLVDRAVCFFNVGPSPLPIFTQEGEHRKVTELAIFGGLARLRQLGPLTDDNLLIFRDRTPKGRHYTERPGDPLTGLQDSSFGAGCFGNTKSS